MSVLDLEFVKSFLRMAQDGWDAGWHERNGGNMSYRLTKRDVSEAKPSFKPKKWCPIADGESVAFGSDSAAEANVLGDNGLIEAPGIGGEYFLITAAGSFFRNVALDPKNCIGIIEVNKKGTKWRQVWGFKGGGRPTSELPAHLLNHEVRKLATDGKSRVIYHAHPTNTIALTFVLPLYSKEFTRALWQMISECAIVFPEGVGVVQWMVPGSVELARATAECMQTQNAVVWAHHGVFVAGESFDLAFGLLHTIEKAADVLVKVKSMTEGGMRAPRSHIKNDDLEQMSSAYGLNLRL